jgi:hypothetical protein
MARKNYKFETYVQDYSVILAAITERLPISYCKWSYVNEIDATNYTLILDSALKSFHKYISEPEHTEYIFTETKSKINRYLNNFEVAPNKSIDEFKLIFFLSTTLAENLKSKGLDIASKIVLTAMVWLLDYRVQTVGVQRKALTKQIVRMIEREQLSKETGEVGLYLTYKCLYKYAKEHQNNA